jgi:LacI family transcriptional regulator
MAERSGRKVNITEVARVAGVSTMTVSRMLNHASKVAPSTRTRVQRVIDELEYHPNPIARGLVTSRTRIIGLLMFDELESRFFQQMLLGVQFAVNTNDYNLLIFSKTPGENALDKRYLGLADGVVCMGALMDNETVEMLEAYNIPHVVVGRRNWKKADPWFLATDYETGFQNVTRYLLNLGHRNIAMMGGLSHYEPDDDKYAGYKKALNEAGITCTPEMIVYDHEPDRLRGVLEKFQPTAVIVEGEKLLLSLLLCARDMGLSIPKQLSIIGTRNDLDIHTLYSLAGIHELTRAMVPRRDLGISATDLLFRIIKGERDIPKDHWLDVIFTEGESCAPPPAG